MTKVQAAIIITLLSIIVLFIIIVFTYLISH